MSGRIDFTMGFNTQSGAHKTQGDNGYRLYILGNFSGRTDVSWDQRKIRRIDIDNFDEVMAQIMPSLEIGSGLTLQFETLDAFHPDVWLDKVQILADLQQLKRELGNPKSAVQAATKIRAYLPAETKKDTPVQVQEVKESQEDTLQRLLGKSRESTASETDTADRLINRVVSPYVTREADPQHQVLINVIDATISPFLRTLLHQPDFKALEALWRATEALVNEESADEQSFYLVDISQTELLAELRNDSRGFEQKLLQHVQSRDDMEQDILLIGDYCFSDSVDDRDLLGYCSRLASVCGAYFLGGAGPALINNSVLAAAENVQNWRQYLKQICADKVVLAYPRYLLRLPYGQKRDPIEAFDFEECPAIPQEDELLWGNPAFVCARVLIRTRQGQQTDEQFFINEIPAFTYDQDGEPVLQPGTQALLNEAQANALSAQGISPVIGFRQRQGIRLLAVATLSGQV